MQPRLWLVLAVQLAALRSGSAHQSPKFMMAVTNETVKLSFPPETFPKGASVYWLRQRRGPGKDIYYEFLASWTSGKGVIYDQKMTPEKLTVDMNFSPSSSFLTLKSVKPEDSGTYFPMTFGSPQTIFGRGTQLTVVDALPTTVQPTKKTTPKKKVCRLSKSKTEKGLTCGYMTLSLLAAGILVLLVSLSVAIHLHCQQRKARIRFMKQFHK